MPPVLLAIPAAAALAYWLMRGGPLRRRRASSPFAGDVDGALEPGSTRRLEPGEEEEPFKRKELPFEDVPIFTGGEYGGGYGPTSGEGGDGDGGYSEAPAATQTQTLASASYARSLFGSGPTEAAGVQYARQQYASAPTTAITIPTSLLTGPAPAPAPAPAPTPTYQLGGHTAM